MILEESGLMMSLTPGAAQRMLSFDDKPNAYPCTPQAFESDPLTAYTRNLTKGAPFFRNHNGAYLVVKSGFSADRQSIFIMTESGYVYRERGGDHIPIPITELPGDDDYSDEVNFALTEVTYEYGLFVHTKIGMGFYPKEYLEEQFADYTKG